MTYLLWIDPGKSTGVALGHYTDDTPYELVKAWQIPGGVKGFSEWWHQDPYYEATSWGYDFRRDVLGCEKFTPRPSKTFNLTLKAVEPLRVEGWLVGEGIVPDYLEGTDQPEWQHPPAMYFAGGKDVEDKKKRMHAWLKAHDLYVTGKTVGQPNADDARSAMAHSIAYLRGIEHLPTLRRYFRG